MKSDRATGTGRLTWRSGVSGQEKDEETGGARFFGGREGQGKRSGGLLFRRDKTQVNEADARVGPRAQTRSSLIRNWRRGLIVVLLRDEGCVLEEAALPSLPAGRGGEWRRGERRPFHIVLALCGPDTEAQCADIQYRAELSAAEGKMSRADRTTGRSNLLEALDHLLRLPRIIGEDELTQIRGTGKRGERRNGSAPRLRRWQGRSCDAGGSL